jgi:predicted Zn-dependent protease
MILRADGYPIQINAATKIAYSAPLSSLSHVKPNIWITYHGTRSPDGIFVADTVGFQANDISKSEGKLIDKNTYDPAAVPSDSKQGAMSKYFLGLNPKKIPPYADAAMQERVKRIGTSLIPAYQRSLTDDNESKINFQFQVIDYPKLHDALTMPSGVILVPRQVVERLENDSQLATVLADNIATALEKQSYRMIPAAKTMGAANAAATVGGFFVPGLGVATSLATGAANKSIQTDLRNQSGRVSLGLMHDAGYDIQQAPIAWWRLATKPTKPLANTTPPPRAINLYQTIGLIWTGSSEMLAPLPDRPTTTPVATSNSSL